jgi:hypothetical protein
MDCCPLHFARYFVDVQKRNLSKRFRKESKPMDKLYKSCAALLVVGLLLLLPGQSQEVPKTMIKITTRIIEPKPEPGSFLAQPKTVWRAGTIYSRTAEAPDPTNHIHALAIIHEPDAWMINLFDRSGRHLLDPGPTFNVHLPIFEQLSGANTKLNEPEFGKEMEFFAANDAKDSAGEMIDGKPSVHHEVTLSGSRLVLWTDAKSKKPVRISRIQGVQRQTIAYLAYDDALAFDPTLFQPPTGIAVVDSK